MNPPNILTLSRFGMAGLLIIFLNATFPGAGVLSLLIFVTAAITDALDGHLARNVYGCTDFGKLMDPLADKVLTAAAFIGFVELGVMPAWMVTLILAREFMVTGLRLLAADKGIVLAAGIWGKHKTIWQMVFIGIVLLLACFQPLQKFSTPFWWAGLFVTVLSVWSGWHYFDQNKNLLTGGK
jgi:CDP-diacylglycerol--glycerol-3-phosphate 3-phosphatidyltransferase